MIPNTGDEQRHRQRRGDRPERPRIGGPEHGQHEDQPHVVGLPDRRHRLVGVLADPLGVLAAARGQLPEPGAEVGPGQHRVQRHSGQHEHERERLQHRSGRRRSGPTPASGSPGSRSGARARRRRTQASPQATTDVAGGERRHSRPESRGAGDRGGGRHHAVDDPRLAADLGDDPAGDQRDQRRRAGEHDARGRTRRELGQPPSPDPARPGTARRAAPAASRSRPWSGTRTARR